MSPNITSCTTPEQYNEVFSMENFVPRSTQNLQSNSIWARLIFHLRRSDHISDVLVCLHWLRVPERIEFKIAVLTYKVLCGAAPRYLGPLNCTADMADRRPLRSSATNRMVVPSYRLSSVGSRAAEFFRLPRPRSGTHCQTTSSLQHPYRLFDAT